MQPWNQAVMLLRVKALSKSCSCNSLVSGHLFGLFSRMLRGIAGNEGDLQLSLPPCVHLLVCLACSKLRSAVRTVQHAAALFRL
eukprot:4094882-Amphidinium_carterae.1